MDSNLCASHVEAGVDANQVDLFEVLLEGVAKTQPGLFLVGQEIGADLEGAQDNFLFVPLVGVSQVLDGICEDVIVGGDLLDLPRELEEGLGAERVVLGGA